MIDLPLKKLQPGMVTAQSIYNSSGASYLTRGTELTRQYIDKLCALGINDLHVLSYSSEIKLLLCLYLLYLLLLIFLSLIHLLFYSIPVENELLVLDLYI